MKRVTVTTPESIAPHGYWFYLEVATHFPLPVKVGPIIEIESTSSSKETDKKWNLYLTPSKFWIKHPIPSLPGERDRYEAISQTVAETWLLEHYGAITAEDIERLIEIYAHPDPIPPMRRWREIKEEKKTDEYPPTFYDDPCCK